MADPDALSLTRAGNVRGMWGPSTQRLQSSAGVLLGHTVLYYCTNYYDHNRSVEEICRTVERTGIGGHCREKAKHHARNTYVDS